MKVLRDAIVKGRAVRAGGARARARGSFLGDAPGAGAGEIRVAVGLTRSGRPDVARSGAPLSPAAQAIDMDALERRLCRAACTTQTRRMGWRTGCTGFGCPAENKIRCVGNSNAGRFPRPGKSRTAYRYRRGTTNADEALIWLKYA